MSTLEGAENCEGLTKDEYTYAMCEDLSPSGSSSIMRHTVRIERKHYEEDSSPFQARISIQSENCELLCDDILCSSCMKQERSLVKSRRVMPSEQLSNSKVMPLCLVQAMKDWLPLSKNKGLFARSLKVG
jgi:hypothetical protein